MGGKTGWAGVDWEAFADSAIPGWRSLPDSHEEWLDGRDVEVLAGAIDHSSEDWRWLAFNMNLEDFGEPPALVSFRGKLFAAGDPPVQLSGTSMDLQAGRYRTGVAEWVPVPVEHKATLGSAIAWARENVGQQGRAVSSGRRPLRGEVEDDPPYNNKEISCWRWEIAKRPAIRLRIELSAHAAVAGWLQRWRGGVLDPVADGWAAAGGQVQWHRARNDPRMRGGLEIGTLVTNLAGWPKARRPAGKRWQALFDELDEERVAGIFTNAHADDLAGFPSDDRWGEVSVEARTVPTRPGTDDPRRIAAKISEPFMRFLDCAVLESLVDSALATLPVTRGRVAFDRGHTFGPWVTIAPAADLDDTALESARRSGVFERIVDKPGLAGDFVWLQATTDRLRFTTDHAKAVTEFFESSGLERLREFGVQRFFRE
ncbi:MAG: hypothetical protein FWD74_01380 [Actinomycetia bacterium]|nr:hypothetical protein [Actinomycetes bacterium]